VISDQRDDHDLIESVVSDQRNDAIESCDHESV